MIGVHHLINAFLFFPYASCFSYDDNFSEKLWIKPLSGDHVYARFEFSVQKEIEGHYRLFPRSVGEIISEYSLRELHFSLAQGLWRYEEWGYPLRDSPSGAELWAVFEGNDSQIEHNWRRLTNKLSGLFCSSLNFIDSTNTIVPKLSFRPQGYLPKGSSYSSRYSSLPPEIVCTENLTPFRKLLPCGAKAGLSTLLNALNIFEAQFISLNVDVQTQCKDKSCTTQLVQSVHVVFARQPGKPDWSFVKLFGTSLASACPVATTSKVYVDISTNTTGMALNPAPTEIISDETHNSAVYDLQAMFKTVNNLNVGGSYDVIPTYGTLPTPALHAHRKISGYGQEQGGIHCTFFNSFTEPVKIIYLDVVPWYLRLYIHTITIKSRYRTIEPDYLHYQPAKDREKPHHLELMITLPAKSTTQLSIDYDYAFLKWTEYPPDANHGFYVGSAVISALLPINFGVHVCIGN